MLVLTRRINESIIIGEDVIVTVLAIRGETVRIGVAAPIEVPVDRQEVRERIKEEDFRAREWEDRHG